MPRILPLVFSLLLGGGAAIPLGDNNKECTLNSGVLDCEGSDTDSYNNCPTGSVIIPSDATTIGQNAFRGCSGITSVDMSGATQLTTIGRYAFHSCSSLAGVKFPDTLEEIKDNAFKGTDLTLVKFPESLREIGQQAFRDSNLETIIFGKTKLTTVGVIPFWNTPLKQVIWMGKSFADDIEYYCPESTCTESTNAELALEKLGTNCPAEKTDLQLLQDLQSC